MSDILVIIQVAIMFLIGLVFLFEGYKIERIIITILWFVLGFNIAKDVIKRVFGTETFKLSQAVPSQSDLVELFIDEMKEIME